MFIRSLLIIAVAATLTAAAAYGAPKGCNKVNFLGSYTRADPNHDMFGDGTVFHSFVYQLNLNSDGTAIQYWTGLPDYMINSGTASPWIGSWTCRSDGNLVVTLILANYFPVPAGSRAEIVSQDIKLQRHSRTTYLFTVDDVNTLTRVQGRTRTYTSAQDPTDASGGTLLALDSSTFTYKRLISSDADLLAP